MSKKTWRALLALQELIHLENSTVAPIAPNTHRIPRQETSFLSFNRTLSRSDFKNVWF